MTMTLIETVTLTSSASSIEFTSIPQDGVDLLLVVSSRSSNASVADDIGIRFNSSSTSYSGKELVGTGSSVFSYNESTNQIRGTTSGANATSTTFGNARFYISNYTSSANKSVSVDSVSENNATNANQNLDAAQWGDSAAITSILVFTGANLAQYSTASLYKIS